MKNWLTLEPDEVRLLNRHFTPGRGGAQVEFVTIHHMAMVGGLLECWRVWQDREASAHYTIDPRGRIGQAVWDRDTAWSNANAYSNARSISIEHSNSAGAAEDWPISPATLEEGAHLVAAICRFYKLGRPVSGKNVRFHNIESGGITSCPYHLRPGGKYHDTYMRRAQYWYDQMTKPAGTPAPTLKEDSIMERYVKDTKAQLTGSPNLGQYPGWDQLGGRTLVDAVAAIGAKLELDGFKDPKEAK
ncbi:N-acetylmuramoyl-L-alanine amidase [Corynebacterium lizhenjunii]|uniref:peptidoglycan recognition protein family protein n=1 Tax=Corynebacterium lizhenjunii TaxID=2709394 RepID=UPI0013EB4246|nr:peptidoglycan recognition family protein [Corynebacterium lizhenjunii]